MAGYFSNPQQFADLDLGGNKKYADAPVVGGTAPIANGGTTGGGSGQNPNFFGGGTYQVAQQVIDPNAFTNPVGANSVTGYNQGQNALYNASQANAPTLAPAALSSGAGDQGQLAVANQEMGIGTGAIQGAAAKTAALQSAQNQQANLSAMGSARGTANPALAGYNVGQANAAVQNTAAQNAVTGAAQEQLGALNNAQAGYSGVTQNQQYNASNINQQAQAQATLQAQQMGLQGQELANYVSANSGQIANTMQAQQSQQQLQVQNTLGTQQLQSAAYNNAASHSIGGQLMGLAGSALGGASAALTHASDRNVKKNIKPSSETLKKFLNKMKAR